MNYPTVQIDMAGEEMDDMITIYKLYIKRLPNGYFYLGRTINDPFTYLGSGTAWKRAIKKYKYTIEDIQTWIIYETENLDKLKEVGLYFSKIFNIVKSKYWLNLIDESGEGLTNPSEEVRTKLRTAKIGKKRKPFTEETLKKFSDVRMGKPLSEKHRESVTLANQSQKERLKRSITLQGHSVSEDARKKISEKIRQKWQTGEYSTRKSRNSVTVNN